MTANMWDDVGNKIIHVYVRILFDTIPTLTMIKYIHMNIEGQTIVIIQLSGILICCLTCDTTDSSCKVSARQFEYYLVAWGYNI